MKNLVSSVIVAMNLALFVSPVFAGNDGVQCKNVQDTVIHQDTVIKEIKQQICLLAQDEVIYTEIALSEVPETLQNAVSSKYAGYSIIKAAKGSDNSFKLVIKNGEHELCVIYDAEGEFVKEEGNEEVKLA